jgi:superfamily I DNA/RNA helicase
MKELKTMADEFQDIHDAFYDLLKLILKEFRIIKLMDFITGKKDK